MTADLQQRLDEALDLARTAQRERAIAISDLRESQHQVDELRADLRDARLSLAAARELLAYHGLTPVQEEME